MSRRHQLELRLNAYAEVRAILSAMRNVALVELRKLGGQLEHQRRAMSTIERAAGDVMRFYAPPGPAPQQASVCIAIGSERGFCGEFNDTLTEAAGARGERLLVVGTRLAERLGEARAAQLLPGASVVEELPAVLEQVAAALEREQRAAPLAPLRVTVLYEDPELARPVAHVIAPLPAPETPPGARDFPPRLTLPPEQFFTALAEQALLLSLQSAFSLSLIAENRRRLEHMDSALRRLDDTTAGLARRMHAARQEEITQEIEVIMLSAQALAEEEARPAAL
ncbi:MAG: F0F1 ATP synthase subunit gamma [Betaproteobacteria bacterium]|jgi:F-type H+-transporting ATPase subunit gamma|nr:F0F1 ATP synthase subunit gamma [Betaproteobacteria bacterium]